MPSPRIRPSLEAAFSLLRKDLQKNNARNQVRDTVLKNSAQKVLNNILPSNKIDPGEDKPTSDDKPSSKVIELSSAKRDAVTKISKPIDTTRSDNDQSWHANKVVLLSAKARKNLKVININDRKDLQKHISKRNKRMERDAYDIDTTIKMLKNNDIHENKLFRSPKLAAELVNKAKYSYIKHQSGTDYYETSKNEPVYDDESDCLYKVTKEVGSVKTFSEYQRDNHGEGKFKNIKIPGKLKFKIENIENADEFVEIIVENISSKKQNVGLIDHNMFAHGYIFNEQVFKHNKE
jgi:hypothetical protein